MIAAIADTHTIIWHINADVRLSPQAKQTIEHAAIAGNTIGFSVITLIEMIYLGEKQRIAPTTFQSFSSRVMTGKAVFLEIPLDYRIAEMSISPFLLSCSAKPTFRLPFISHCTIICICMASRHKPVEGATTSGNRCAVDGGGGAFPFVCVAPASNRRRLCG